MFGKIFKWLQYKFKKNSTAFSFANVKTYINGELMPSCDIELKIINPSPIRTELFGSAPNITLKLKYDRDN